jgi:hypothetical protein
MCLSYRLTIDGERVEAPSNVPRDARHNHLDGDEALAHAERLMDENPGHLVVLAPLESE